MHFLKKDGSFSDGCFFNGYFLDGCFLDGCFLDFCFLVGCFFDGCFSDGCFLSLILTKLPQEKLDAQATLTFCLLVAQASSFLIHLPLPSTFSQATYGYLPLTVQHLYGLQETMPFHWSSSVSHPTFTQGSRGFP